jgi:hypothetical protein
MPASPPRRRSRVPHGPLERGASALLSSANARRLAKRLSTLRGAAMKLGQLLSLEGDDLLPPEFAEALAVLRADGDAMPDAQRERLLAAEWGAGWRERFADFDPEPIAAASIGQVHRATARDGRALALEIQYPGVATSIESDVDNLVTALRWSRLLPADVDLADLAAEAKGQLAREADYEREAACLERYGALLADEPEVAMASRPSSTACCCARSSSCTSSRATRTSRTSCGCRPSSASASWTSAPRTRWRPTSPRSTRGSSQARWRARAPRSGASRSSSATCGRTIRPRASRPW